LGFGGDFFYIMEVTGLGAWPIGGGGQQQQLGKGAIPPFFSGFFVFFKKKKTKWQFFFREGVGGFGVWGLGTQGGIFFFFLGLASY